MFSVAFSATPLHSYCSANVLASLSMAKRTETEADQVAVSCCVQQRQRPAGGHRSPTTAAAAAEAYSGVQQSASGAEATARAEQQPWAG